jgi:hypothetical protein
VSNAVAVGLKPKPTALSAYCAWSLDVMPEKVVLS